MAIDTTTKPADLTDILAKLKLTDQTKPIDQSTADQLNTYLRQPNIDFTNATSEELNNYQNALNFYKNVPTNAIDKNSLVNDIIKNYIGENNTNYKPDQIQSIANQFADAIINNNKPANLPQDKFDYLKNKYQPLIQNGSFSVKANFDDTLLNNQKTIQSLQSSRGQTSSDQQAVTDYLANAPQQLTQSRTDFYNQQRVAAQDYLKTNVIPKNIEPIERSGLASDREIASMIANLYGGVQSSLDQSESAQAIADVNFFSDAAYKTKLQDLINTHGDVQSQISSDYNTAATQQQQGFQRAQSQLQNNFDVNLFKQQNEQALNEYNAKLKQQQDNQNKQNTANMWGSVGGAVGSVGGAIAFGPAGAVIGNAAGSAVGSMASGAP